MSFNYLSLCAGIEAASCAWHPLGWRAVAFSEIDAFPSAVLAHHYPSTPNWGDMTKYEEWPHADVDVLVGGTPCQSFSVAGLRKGLADPRGNLMLTYGAIAAKYRPRWLVWENVPGVLSSNGGRDFGTFLGMLAELGYGFAYRVLDAQFFGVAQRRRRVFVVGCLGDWRRAAAVLFERASLRGDPAPRREARQGTACTPTSGTLRSRHNFNTTEDASGGNLIPEVANPLTARMHKGVNTTCDEGQTMVAHALTANGFDASEDGTGRGTPLVPVAFDIAQITSPGNVSNPQPGDPCHPLSTRADCAAIAFDARQSDVIQYGDKTRPLDTDGHTMGIAFQTRGSNIDVSDIAGTIGTNADRASGSAPMMLRAMQVRRLTPRECERLQGFPDDYTLIPVGKGRKPAADGPRYKALGNSMAVPVMAWIGRRIAEVEAIAGQQEAA